jgi:hypothetical protein
MAPSVAGGATEARRLPFRPGGAPWRPCVGASQVTPYPPSRGGSRTDMNDLREATEG